VIPPKRDARFVAAMELILDTYALPPDPAVPLICFDECGKALQAHRRDPLPGPLVREDPEYVRQGSANLFLAYAPHLGWRHVSVTTQRTAVDFALAMRELADVHFPAAQKLIVVLDNLNTHHVGALYTAFPADEAGRLARTLEFRYTPRHGSWLNMAELELAVLSGQCLDRRIPDRAMLDAEVAAWAAARNAVAAPAHWDFTTADARTRLSHLYPIPICDSSV
jgi:DDE superfamily endonuclease